MSPNKNAIVETEYGPVKGVQKSSALGRNFYNFQSIPYMKAPIGKLRFRDAVPLEKWSEPLDVSGERLSYSIMNVFTGHAEGQEDAGIISVSTPYMNRKLPVGVYIHGGGFQFSYGTTDMLGFDYMLQKDIVLVSFNYRVGPIGFLSLKDPSLGIPGNAGLKDQVMALKWVQKNIANFGGDPNNVTIFGTSAGAVSVHMLMISDLAKGLFHRAVPMSGVAFIKAWPFTPPKDLTERLATCLGWDGTGGEKEILKVLEDATAEEIVRTESKLLSKKEIYNDHILFPFTPVIEPYVNEKTFLSKDPIILGRNAWSKDMDIMIGGTTLEGSLMGIFDGSFAEHVQEPESLTLTRELFLEPLSNDDKKKALVYGEKLRKLYFGDNLPSSGTLSEYFAYAGDLHFWHGIYRAILSRVNSSGVGKTYFYRFDLQTSLNFCKMHFKATSVEGAAHGDDIGYLFKPATVMIKAPAIESFEFDKIKLVVSLVTSFIITGNPNSFENDITWEPVTATSPVKCLNIANDSTEMISLPEFERLKVWDEILNDAKIPLY